MRPALILVPLFLSAVPVWSTAAGGLVFDPLWTVSQNPGANAVAHGNERVYVASGTTLTALDMASGVSVDEITVDSGRFAAITSVAAHGDLVAIALASAVRTEPGWVQLYHAPGGAPVLDLAAEVMVGAGPDMLTFTPDGSRIVVANEGEPVCTATNEYAIDPEGSISVVDVASRLVQTVTFEALNSSKEELSARGVRFFGPNATVAQDLEPEHVTVGPLGLRAWITLQENNAIAVVDLFRNPPVVSAVLPLGVKDHGLPENALDVSDRDGTPGALETYPGLYGMYLPDGIDGALIGGKYYLFTANEGDTRDYPCFSEERRVADLTLAPSFPADEVAALSRLRVTNTRGEEGGVFTQLYAFGGRSFAVWNGRGRLIYESGSTMELLLAERFRDYYEDSRSDDKGPEPEDLVLGRIDGIPYLFVGLERANGVMAFDVRNPSSPTFATFLANPLDAEFPEGENPERLDFVPAQASATDNALLLVTNEVSGRTRAFELMPTP